MRHKRYNFHRMNLAPTSRLLLMNYDKQKAVCLLYERLNMSRNVETGAGRHSCEGRAEAEPAV